MAKTDQAQAPQNRHPMGERPHPAPYLVLTPEPIHEPDHDPDADPDHDPDTEPDLGPEMGPDRPSDQDPAQPAEGISETPKPKRLRGAAACRRYAQQCLAERLPEVMPEFLQQAQKGSNPHLKTLLQLCGLDRALPPASHRRGKEKGLEEILREQWQRDDEAEAARTAAASTAASATGDTTGNGEEAA